MLAEPSLEKRASWIVCIDGNPGTLEIPVNVKTGYLTHGLFRYAGKLPPPLVAYLLTEFTESGDLVVDPMCGGGTTAIETASSGRPSLNFDINPVSRLVTTALAQGTDVGRLLRFAEDLAERAEEEPPPPALRDYFSNETYGLLRSGLSLAETLVEKVLVLSLARTASFANTKKINTVVDPLKRPEPPRKLLKQAARRFADAFDDLNALDLAAADVQEAAAHALQLDDGVADFVLLHPPYLTNTAFSESMHLQLLLLGREPKTIRKSELAYRGSYFHVPNGLHKYLLGWAKTLAEATRVVRSGGHIAVVIGDGRIDRVRIPVGTITAEYGADLGLQLIYRGLHLLNNQTGWTLSRRMTAQHVLVFRAP